MRELFTFENLPMAIIIGLVAFSWFILLTILVSH